ncbi:hypothetical protein [Streptomyces sp. NBC_00687]|uniref:hypothetical protein n=1 Tax=Streptomyces sp. NBC_00687 TaxID=2975807 RepID=UPI00225043C6|nr:hypothetical protein [Streptomyces sp. NBC_00687]MCX4912853.1 hypothetical protein [Streptomyces sp. NBC_00687]
MHDVINEEAPAPVDVLPQHQAEISFENERGDLLTVSVHGPAAFVARVVASVADAFEEDAQR